MTKEGKLWGGAFEADTDALVERLNSSLPFDRRLWRHDIRASIAHATMLGAAGILPAEEAARIVDGLQAIEADLVAGSLQLPDSAEDIHTAIELLLRERIGPLAGKLHTARSRNDQVATDTRLYLRDAIDALDGMLRSLQTALLAAAEREIGTILPGYTHLQHAQPVLLAHHLLAYFWMLQRDRERLRDARRRVNVLPLGAGALAGTGFPVDRHLTARLLEFEAVAENSMDAVSDRDFAAEVLAAASLIAVHLSRLGEELILWSSPEFGFVRLHDSVTTGSSIMPQKKNPDVAELARGKVGRVLGDFVAVVTMMKGQPLAYNKDNQEDKESLFDAIDTLSTLLPPFTRMVETARFQRERMASALRGDFSTATDLADWLACQGVPFREAHHRVGTLVRRCLERGIGLEDLTEAELREWAPEFAARPLPDLSPRGSVEARQTQGGTATESVRHQIRQAKSAMELRSP